VNETKNDWRSATGRTACVIAVALAVLAALHSAAFGADVGLERASKGRVPASARSNAVDSRPAVEFSESKRYAAFSLPLRTGEVPCGPDPVCGPLEIVFIVDTSGSMGDEAAALCTKLPQITADLAAGGITVQAHVLGITETPGRNFACLSTDVVTLLGGNVPGEPTACPFPEGASAYESWGPATAIVAERFDWAPGALRVIVPISDEGPCNGTFPDGCNDPGDDRDSISNAIAVAAQNGVIVSPITGNSSDACVDLLAANLADGTGGQMRHTEDPKNELKAAVAAIVQDACLNFGLCDDGNPCTEDDHCVNGICVGSSIPSCFPCAGDDDCAAQDACEDPYCDEQGICDARANFDAEQFCCNPANGDLQTLDDENTCTDDVCDRATGAVAHAPLPESPCDDGLACTVLDACTATAACAGVDIESVECLIDDDCFGMLCNADTASCACIAEPKLCLTALPGGLGGACYEAGEEIVVNVDLGRGLRTIAGGQFSISYDPTLFDFISADTGDAVDVDSPFANEVIESVDEGEGRVFYVVLIDVAKRCSIDREACFTDGDCSQAPQPQTCEFVSGTVGPAVMATLRFRARAPCTSGDICFIDDNPQTTLLTDDMGDPVDFVPCCAQDLRVAAAAPTVSCPSDAAVNADAGALTAEVRWGPVTANGGCGGTVEMTCTAAHTFPDPSPCTDDEQCGPNATCQDGLCGREIGHLIAQGGLFPAGLSRFECYAADECAQQSQTCSWSVNVSPANVVEVDVELSQVMHPGPLRRCIEFEFFRDCTEEPQTTGQVLNFGLPFDFPGLARRIQLKVPAGIYGCVLARDPWHTLRSVADMEIVGNKYVARFLDDPLFDEGNWLRGGNLDGSNVIDVIDIVRWTTQEGAQLDPDTLSCAPGPTSTLWHADINGDGLVDVIDLEFINRHFLAGDKQGCCSRTLRPLDNEPILQISLKQARYQGLGDLTAADVNGDGLVDLTDLDLIQRGYRAKRITRTPR